MIKAIVFDVDGTLTKIKSIWRLIHEELGTWRHARINRELYYAGKIDYIQWAKLDSALWRGVKVKRIMDVVRNVELVEEVEYLMSELKKRGYYIGLISAGVNFLPDYIRNKLNLDYSLSNELITRNGLLTGEVIVNVPYPDKFKGFKKFIKNTGFEESEVATVGDDPTDLYDGSAIKILITHSVKPKGSADFYVKRSKILDILRYIP